MVAQTCPKCASAVLPNAVVCPNCDCILDLSFLELGEEAPVDADGWEDEKTGPDVPVAPRRKAPAGADALFDAGPATEAGADAAPGIDDVGDDVDGDGDGDGDADGGEDGTPDELVASFGDPGQADKVSDDDQPFDFDGMLASSTASFPLPHTGSEFVAAPIGSSHSIDKMIEPGAVLAVRTGVDVAGLGISAFEQHVVSFIDGERTVARLGKKAGLGFADLKIAIGMLADRHVLFVRGHVRPSLRSMLGDVDLDQSSDDLELPLPPEPARAASPKAVFGLPLDALTALAPEGNDEESVFNADAPVRSAISRTATSSMASLASSAPPPAPVPAPAAAAVASGPQVEPAKRAQAQQVLELGLADLRAGKKPRALGYVKMAADLDPGNETVKALLKDWGKAERIALDAVPESEEQRLAALGQKAQAEGQLDRAIELYKKAIALAPLEPEYRNLLGIVLALNVRDFTAAASEFMKACELAPTNLAYRSNLQRTFKIAEGGAPSGMLAGKDSDGIREAALAGKKPAGFLDKLRGGKK